MADGAKDQSERIAERAIEAVQNARQEKRPLAPEERAKVKEMQGDPDARREVERTRLGMTILLLGGLVLLTVGVVLLAVHLLG